jgi:uncharacterized protein
MLRFRRVRPAALLLAAVVTLAGCGLVGAEPTEPSDAASPPPTPTAGAPTFVPTEPGLEPDGQAGEPPGEGPPGEGPTDLPPQPDTTPDGQVVREAQGAVASGNEAGGTDLTATTAYISAIIDSAHRAWAPWFAQAGYQTPYAYYYVIQPGQTYTAQSSACVLQGTAVYASDYPNAFYCRDGQSANDPGQLIFPVQTMARMWSGDVFGRSVQTGPDLKRVGDFAAGVIIAHEFGHHIYDELQVATGRPRPPNPQFELLADCFSGVYAYALNLGGGLEPGDVDEAVNALQAIGDNLGSHGTGPERENAFRIGLFGTQTDPRGGVPLTCLQVYWPRFLTG